MYSENTDMHVIRVGIVNNLDTETDYLEISV